MNPDKALHVMIPNAERYIEETLKSMEDILKAKIATYKSVMKT